MSLFDWFADRRKGQFVGKVTQESEESDGLWEKCPECGQVVYRKDLIDNSSVCSNCGHHNRIESKERIRLITDPNTFKSINDHITPVAPLGFKDRRAYADRTYGYSDLRRHRIWQRHAARGMVSIWDR